MRDLSLFVTQILARRNSIAVFMRAFPIPEAVYFAAPAT
jgi:hypothetical protein